MKFITQTLKNFKTTGAIAPVRQKTAELMVRQEFDTLATAKQVVEFGPGTGVITKEILQRIPDTCKLILVEVNTEFANELRHKYGHLHNVEIQERYAQIVNDIKVNSCDAVFSSIPLSLVDVDTRREVFCEAWRLIKNGGIFKQYQYSRLTEDLLIEVMKRPVKRKLTFTNIIPTYFFTVIK